MSILYKTDPSMIDLLNTSAQLIIAKNSKIIEPWKIYAEEVQVCTSVNYYGEKIADTKIENLTNEEITEEYQQMTPVQRRKFNQLV